MSTPIRVLIVDDQALFREGLHTLLSVQTDLQVVGEARNGEEALRLAAAHEPDIISDGPAYANPGWCDCDTPPSELRIPAIKVIVLTTFDDDEDVFEGLRAGAAGYLLKDVPSEKLTEAFRGVARGESFLEPSIVNKIVAEFARLSPRGPTSSQPLIEPLSERELEILRLLGQGASNKEIADHLVITVGTVKNHLTSIMGKLGVRDRTQAALKARELGII